MKRPYQILVADDNATNQAIVRKVLEQSGYRVDGVCNGQEVIQALERRSYDLVIMDCLMPVMDGFAATRVIRQADPARFDPGIPILAITALAPRDGRERCLNAGMTDHLSKPIFFDDLLNSVSRLLPHKPVSKKRPTGEDRLGSAETAAELQAKFQADVLQSMSGRIAAEARQWQGELRAYHAAADFVAIKNLAHKIRGTADIIGRTALSKATEELEFSAVDAGPDRVDSLIGRVNEELRLIAAEIGPANEVVE